MDKAEWDKIEEAALVAAATTKAKVYARVDRAVDALNYCIRNAENSGIEITLHDRGHGSMPRLRLYGKQPCGLPTSIRDEWHEVDAQAKTTTESRTK